MTATRSWIGDWVVLLPVLLALSLGVIAVGGMAGTAPVGNDPVPAGSVITENESNDATTPPVRLNGTLGSEYDSVTHFEVSSSADAVVVLNGSTRLEAYDASGDRMWTTALAGSVDTTPTVSDGVVYVTMVNQSDADLEDGDLRAYDASDGALRWSAREQLDDGTDIEIDDDTAPVVGEHVYAHRRGGSESYDNVEIHALNRGDGSLVWSEEVSEDARSVTFTAASGTVYIGEGDGVRALNASTRELEWDRSSRLLGSAVAADPVVHDDTLYVAESSGDTHAVYALNTSDGGARWRTPVNDEIDHSPVVVDGVPVVASGQSLHALDPSTGEGTEEALTGGTILDIAYDGGELLVASEDGHLRSMNADLALNWRYDLPSPREEPGEVAWPIAVGSTGETTFVHGGIGGQLGETQPDEAIYRLEPTSIAVTDVSVSDGVARPGDVVTAEANVSNEGGDASEFEVTFEVEGPFTTAGPKTYTESIALAAGEESTVTTTFEIRSTGEYAVTALESGTDGTTDPRPAPATVNVTRVNPDHDWNQVDFDPGGSDWNPDAHAPAGPLEAMWEHQTGTGADHNIGINRILVDNGSVVVHNETTLRTLDLQTGALKWEFRPDAKRASNLSDPADVDERITSTAIADGVVYVLMDYCKEQFCDTGDHASRLYALDMDSGTSVWAEYVNHSETRATEELTIAGGSVLFQLYDADPGVRKNRLYEVGTATGQERDSRNISSKDFQNDFVDLSASQLRATDEHVFFVQNNSVHTLNRSSLDRVDNRSFGTYDLRVASDGETIYVADRYHPDDTNVSERRNGTVYALNPNDLQDAYWTTTANRVRESDDDAGIERILDIAVTGDRVYISSGIGFNYDGGDGTYALDADTGDVVWQENVGDRSVTVADGVVYAQEEDWMYSLDGSTGGVSAKTGTPSTAPFSQTATVSDGVVLAASNERVWAFTESAAPTIEDVSLNETSGDPGDLIEVNTTITNPTDRRLDEIQIDLDEAGWFSTRIDTDLAPGETKTVTAHTEAPSESGDYSVQATVSNPAIDEYYGVERETVSERVPYRVATYGIQPQFEGVIMSNLRFANDTVGVGENVTVLADLENFEGADRNLSLLAESGEFDDVRGNVTVPAGERMTAEIPIETDDWVTDMAVTLDGVRVGTVDVLDSRLLASMNSYDEVEPGTTVPFLVDVVNDGNEANETTIDLTIDGAVVDSRTVSLAPEEDATVELTHTFFETGTYDVSLAGAFERGFGGYESRIDIGGSADIHVNQVSDDAGVIAVGDPVSFNVSGANDAGTAGEMRLELEVEGKVVGDTTVFVDGDSTFRSVTFETSLTHTFYEPGEYNVSIDGVAHENGSVTVLEADDPVAGFRFDPDAPAPGETITFDASRSSAPGTIAEYRWDFTGDGVVDETTTDPVLTHTFGAEGTFNVSLTIETTEGGTAAADRTVSVAESTQCAVRVESGDSIQAGVLEANAGETICVESGTYSGVIEINDPVDLRAADPDDRPVIDGGGEDWTGFNVVGASDVRIDGFDIVNIADWSYGVYAENATDVTVRNVSVSQMTQGYGMAFERSSGVVIADSTVSGTYMGLASWENGDVTVTDTEVSAETYGIELFDGVAGAETIITDSEVTGAGTSGVWVSNGTAAFADSITISETNFTGNTEAVTNEIDNAGVTATDNWWGHETGPSGDVSDPESGTLADGDGDAVSSGVVFDPWLTDPSGAEPNGSTTIEAPITEDDSEIRVDVGFEGTANESARVVVENVATGATASSVVFQSGTVTIDVADLGGIETGGTIRVELYETPTEETLLASDETSVAPTPTATFDMSGLDAPDQAVAGETIAVDATVSNVGDVSGTATVEITFDGEVVSTQQVSLNSSESVTASATVSTADLDPDNYTYGVTVEDVSQSGELILETDGTPDVTDTPGSTDTPDDTETPGSTDTPDDTETPDGNNETTDDDSQGLPGFGFGIALVALFAVVVFARFRG